MRIRTINGINYRLPGSLNDFQLDMYVHLINWKWKHITKEPGHFIHRGKLIPYDAILPTADADDLKGIWPYLVNELRQHRKKYHFRWHLHFNHMASSQAANVNLLLPVLISSHANQVLGVIKKDFARLATEQLDKGYCLEFWGQPHGSLGDKTTWSGTDSDIAIAYHNHADELCLWLIEHKLTEKEFTPCGGFKSKGKTDRHDCSRSFDEILHDKSTCYQHDVRHRKYWTITHENEAFFGSHTDHDECPFKGGMNQLWRNQLLGLSIEQDDRQPFKQVFFSVVKHPRNDALDETINAYQKLTGDNPRFSVHTSEDFIRAADAVGDPDLRKWTAWYRDLYML